MHYPIWIIFTTIISLYIGLNGLKKKSLSTSGAISAIVVGFITFSLSVVVGIVLIAFFLSSSKLTKLGAEKKRLIEKDYKTGGQRTAIQVFSNAFSATILLLLIPITTSTITTPTSPQTPSSLLTLLPSPSTVPFLTTTPMWFTALIIGALAHYACCCADTWSSELGSLSPSPPHLITTLEKVPAGTNGGVSRNGTLAGLVGGVFIGVVASIVVLIEILIWSSSTTTTEMITIMLTILTICTISGFLGTALDSILGSFLQCSVWDTKDNIVIEILSWDDFDKKIGKGGRGYDPKIDGLGATTGDKTGNKTVKTNTVQPMTQNDYYSVDNTTTQRQRQPQGDNVNVSGGVSDGDRYRHICGYPTLDNHQVNLLSSSIIGFGVAMCTLLMG